jgi:hypothetical protein
LATVAVKLWVWPGWTVMDAGATDTEMEGWGGGITVGGGSLLGADEECALAFEGTEAQPPARKAANRQNTARATAASRTARMPGSGFKVEILQCLPLAGRHFLSRDNCRAAYRTRNIAVYVEEGMGFL